MNKLILPGKRSGTVLIPSSKSVVHRLMICAALGTHPVTLTIDGLSKDILATADCLSALGARIDATNQEIRIQPIEQQREHTEEVLLPAGESGSTLRFLLPVVGALGQKAVFQMEGRLSSRPLAPFDRLLTEHGMHIHKNGEKLYCSGKLFGGSFSLPGNVSSQYFSGLLLALPILEGESSLYVEGDLESEAYVQLTEDALRISGVRFENKNGLCWNIPGSQRTNLPTTIRAEGDWSNAAFYLCMGALSKTGICVRGLNPESTQGDRKINDILRAFGAKVDVTPDGTVRASRDRAIPIRIDAAPVPDLVPVLAVLCCAAKGDSEIYNAARVRLKESDRLHTTTELIRRCGGTVDERPDGLTIHGNGQLRGGKVDAYNDHRIAMSAAVAACLCQEQVLVTEAESVEKSYPAFWENYEALNRTFDDYEE